MEAPRQAHPMTTPKNPAADRVAKLLYKAADIADKHGLMLDNGAYVDCLISTLAFEVEQLKRRDA